MLKFYICLFVWSSLFYADFKYTHEKSFTADKKINNTYALDRYLFRSYKVQSKLTFPTTQKISKFTKSGENMIMITRLTYY